MCGRREHGRESDYASHSGVARRINPTTRGSTTPVPRYPVFRRYFRTPAPLYPHHTPCRTPAVPRPAVPLRPPLAPLRSERCLRKQHEPPSAAGCGYMSGCQRLVSACLNLLQICHRSVTNLSQAVTDLSPHGHKFVTRCHSLVTLHRRCPPSGSSVHVPARR